MICAIENLLLNFLKDHIAGLTINYHSTAIECRTCGNRSGSLVGSIDDMPRQTCMISYTNVSRGREKPDIVKACSGKHAGL